MDDYDDYFDDDIVFDDQVLAVLDKVEQTYMNQNRVSSPQPPPAKRQKTDTGWTSSQSAPTSGSQLAAGASSLEVDELPEISLCRNDYAFQQFEELGEPSSAQQISNKDTQRYKTRVSDRVSGPSNSQKAQENISSSLNRASRHRNPSISPVLPPSAGSSNHASHLHSSRSSANRSQSQLNRLSMIASALAMPDQVGSMPQVPGASTTVTSSTPLPRHPVPLPSQASAPQTGDHVDTLMVRLQELREENLKLQNSLREAEEARMAKDGEVTVLRRCIERTAQDHSLQIAKLKAAKDEADNKQADMQREMRDELERLRTQFIFKQHEVESNARKVPMSTRSRKNLQDVQLSQTPRFNRPNLRNGGPSHVLESTPVRAALHPVYLQKSPEKSRKSAMLPGFENSFLESTPNRHIGVDASVKPTSPEIMPPPQRLFAKELQLMQPSQDMPITSSGQSLNDDVRMEDDFNPPHQDSTLGSELASSPIDENGDLEMEEEVLFEEQVEIKPFNWRAELTRIILTHTHSSCCAPTMQILIESTSASVSSSSIDYSTTLSQILGIIASTCADDDYEAVIPALTRRFVSVCIALNLKNLISSLIPLLNLLTTLVNSLPSFSASFLSQASSGSDDRPEILVLICDVILQHLTATKHCERASVLVDEVMSFLQALCWNTPEAFVEKMGCISSSTEILMTLLHTSQPPWFLARTTYLLVLMSTYPALARSLLSLPDSKGEDGQRTGVQKVPQLDRLCSFLIDNTRQDTEFQVVKSNIIALFTILSLAHTETCAALTVSSAVVASLVLHLNDMSTPIWEDDDALAASSSLTSSIIKSLNQAIHLLHHLVFDTRPVLNLRYKLQSAPHRPFNGVTHIFIVTFGRLSYAAPPDWISQENKYELLLLRELARDLLDLVVDGPEGDSVYAAYQDNEENIDEGDMEEQLLGPRIA